MVTAIEPVLRRQLIDRRQKLVSASSVFHRPAELTRLLDEVDSALQRMDDGIYGLCEVCHDPVETERIIANPTERFCIDHLTVNQQRALEEDLQLAAQIQSTLLPPPTRTGDGWEVAYHYQPAGPVSGDYCDLINGEKNSLYFVLGDVSGKGVAASMLMAHLHAMFRTLASINMPLEQMVERASRVFCESTLPTQYATLVCGKAAADGGVEICNAGHLPALLTQRGDVTQIAATGLPVGMFCSESFSVTKFRMQPGDSLLLYTDGCSERSNSDGQEYGTDRLSEMLRAEPTLSPRPLLEHGLRQIEIFAQGNAPVDDVTLMAIQRIHIVDAQDRN
ncbi:MAG TPA: SpoIIE family protein phosphatase [Pyrinomonadaceae bacterium]|nr:SpoIIE family protein phosphatase [Pyrinomonadaceae bacterium]